MKFADKLVKLRAFNSPVSLGRKYHRNLSFWAGSADSSTIKGESRLCRRRSLAAASCNSRRPPGESVHPFYGFGWPRITVFPGVRGRLDSFEGHTGHPVAAIFGKCHPWGTNTKRPLSTASRACSSHESNAICGSEASPHLESRAVCHLFSHILTQGEKMKINGFLSGSRAAQFSRRLRFESLERRQQVIKSFGNHL